MADQIQSKLAKVFFVVRVNLSGSANICECLRYSQLSNSELETLPVELPEVHVLNAACHKASRVSWQKRNIFDFVRQTVNKQLLTNDGVCCVLNQKDRENEFWRDSYDYNMLIIIRNFQLVYN